MPRNFKLGALKSKISTVSIPRNAGRDPRLAARVLLGTLLLANMIAAAVAFRPWADSPAQLEGQLADLHKQHGQRKAQIDRLLVLVRKSEQASKEGEQFLSKYFLSRRTASSTLVNDLTTMAKAAGIKPREHTFAFEPVEGSDMLSMMTITANYEGAYTDLVQYVNRLDRSLRLFVVESLAAAPQQGSAGLLNITMRVNVFVREDSTPPAAHSEQTAMSKAQGETRP
ncbi:MAG: hypothetical protein HY235_25180 [Acidobacteria bacterium]|nr:hypothetical protein [Acidobacteriota bacterium]